MKADILTRPRGYKLFMNKFRLEFRRFLTICRLLKEGDRGKLFERKIDTFLKKKKKKIKQRGSWRQKLKFSVEDSGV